MKNLDIPVVTTVHNNYLYLDNFIVQCSMHNLNNLIVIDSHSTDPLTLEYLKDNKSKFQLITLEENLGPRYPIHSNRMSHQLPNKFLLSDPDIKLNEATPKNFIDILKEVSEEHKVAKVGLALDISSKALDKNIKVFSENESINLIDWESQYWQEIIGLTSDQNPIYRAAVDTTFSFFNKNYFDSTNELKGVRIGGNFTCTHLPWLLEQGLKIPNNHGDSYIYSSINTKVDSNSLTQSLYIAYLKIQLENLNDQVQELNNGLQATYSSKSWMLTKPLRVLLNFFQKSH